MREHEIPLTRKFLFGKDITEKQLEAFFMKLNQIPNPYLEDIADGYNPDYVVQDTISIKLLRDFIENKVERNDKYFDTIKKMKERMLVEGKPVILIKK